MPTTTYNAHWADKVNLTVTDANGASEKTGGTGGSFDASARVEQMWEGGYSCVLKATYGVAGNMAIGVATSYIRGAVTVASLLACWSIEGANCVARESNTSRFSGAVALGDVLEIRLMLTGSTWALSYYQNGVLRHTSAITSATIASWRPFRFVTTHSGAGSKWSAVTIDAESAELFDPDVAGSYDVALLEDPYDAIEMTATVLIDPALAAREVHAVFEEAGAPPPPAEGGVYARAFIV